MNGVKTTQAVGVPASIHDSTADLVIGAQHGGTNLMDGYASMCFICAAALSDSIVGALFQQTRAMYGV